MEFKKFALDVYGLESINAALEAIAENIQTGSNMHTLIKENDATIKHLIAAIAYRLIYGKLGLYDPILLDLFNLDGLQSRIENKEPGCALVKENKTKFFTKIYYFGGNLKNGQKFLDDIIANLSGTDIGKPLERYGSSSISNMRCSSIIKAMPSANSELDASNKFNGLTANIVIFDNPGNIKYLEKIFSCFGHHPSGTQYFFMFPPCKNLSFEDRERSLSVIKDIEDKKQKKHDKSIHQLFYSMSNLLTKEKNNE